MLVRGATLALISWAGSWLAGCGDPGSSACTTRVTPEVCETPANLRMAGLAQVTWVTELQPELTPAPLVDGRYLLTERTLACGQDFVPPLSPLRVQGVVEVQGCVLRLTSIAAESAEPQVSVSTFRSRTDGMLELKDACSGSGEGTALRYGFDGATLLLPVSLELPGADGSAHACSGFDSYVL
jgi:hypothetical protein